MKSKKIFKKTILYLTLILGSVLFLFPFFWLIRSSLMEIAQIFIMPPIWIPNPIKFSNYQHAMTILPFNRYFINTSILVVTCVLGVVISSSICAFSFARMKWPGRDKVFAILITGMMLPYAVTLIPTFLGWSALGFTNSFLPLIVPSWFGGGIFNIFLLRQFLMTIPKELDEAAFVDGAGYFIIYAKIILPLIKPALIVVGLFTFLGTWNDFMGPMVYLNNEKLYTLALGLKLFQGEYNAQWELLMAASAIVILPILVVFIIGQKYFIEGIAMTGIKA